jgi:fermentation-respiration switch protein FrsA (DUF1100 family)
MVRSLACLAFLVIAAPALAQGLDPAVLRALQGAWLLAPDNGEPGCRMTLEPRQTIGGYGLTLAPDCARRVPRIADAAAWNPMGGMAFLDPTRRTLLKLEEQEDGTYKAGGATPGYAFIRAPSWMERLPRASDTLGDWVMKRPDGEIVCRIQLADRPPPGGQESFALRVAASGCQPAVTRLRLASWRIETMKPVLYGTDGNSLSFVPTPTGFTKAEAEGGRPLILERAGR